MSPCLFNISFTINEAYYGSAQQFCDVSNTTVHCGTVLGILHLMVLKYFTEAQTLTARAVILCYVT